MAILAECPMCHQKQATKNKVCKCGKDLDRAKRSNKVRYWISYYLFGKQRREPVGFSIEKAREAESKRKVQKREDRFFEITIDHSLTFNQLTKWYLGLQAVKRLSSYPRYKSTLGNFNSILGERKVGATKPIDLEDYQDKREGQGAAPTTIDIEMVIAGGMVRRAWDNDLVSDRPVKAFRKVKNKLKIGANARDRILTIAEYKSLQENASQHIKALLITGYYTGMRAGELMGLRWTHIDRKNSMIRLPAELTKEKRTKRIPINHHVKAVLDGLPRALHHDFVFTFNGEPIKCTFRVGIKNACENAGIAYGQKVEGGFRFHDIRTTFKTNMLRAGVDKVIRDVIVGRSLRGMDAFYLKPSDEDLHAAMDKFTAYMDGLFSASSDQTSDQVTSKES